MDLSVAVVSSAPLYRRGLASLLLDAGLIVSEHDAVATWWAATPTERVVVVSLDVSRTESVELERVREESPDLTVLVAVEETTAAVFAEVLGLRAFPLPLQVSIEDLADTVGAATRGWVHAPAIFLWPLATAFSGARAMADISAEDRHLLQLLADGADSAAIGAALGCSPATVGRRLSKLYGRLSVQGRNEAVAWAARARAPDEPTGA